MHPDGAYRDRAVTEDVTIREIRVAATLVDPTDGDE